MSETSRSQSNQDGKADAKTKGEPGAAPATAPGGSAPGAGSITPQRSGGGKASGRSGKGEKGSGVKKGSGKAKGTKGPKVAGADPPKTSVAEDPIYAMARGICDDRALIDSLPEDYPRDAETLANLARQFAPPGKEKEAYEGCLAGLRSLGL